MNRSDLRQQIHAAKLGQFSCGYVPTPTRRTWNALPMLGWLGAGIALIALWSVAAGWLHAYGLL
jgi:hypothetical protein